MQKAQKLSAGNVHPAMDADRIAFYTPFEILNSGAINDFSLYKRRNDDGCKEISGS
jgi:hypothetical protein